MQNIFKMLKKNLISILKLVFILLIILFVIVSIYNELKSVNFAETILLIRNFSNTSILLLVLLGLLAVTSITLYDFLIADYLKLDLKPWVILNVSYLASTINNISGLGGLTGASIRSVIFKKSINNKDDIMDYNLLLIPATAIGLSVMALISLIKYEYISHVFQAHTILLLVLIVFFIYLIIYPFIDIIFYKFKKNSKAINTKARYMLKLKLLLVSIFEWTLAYSLFCVIIRSFNNSINLFTVFGIFTLASIAGIISMLPGGVGSFDLVAIVGLQRYGLPTENILAALILFRVFYYFIPLVIGLILTLIIQTQSENSSTKIFKLDKFQEIIEQTSSITNLLLSILVLLSGIVLLTSALIPSLSDRIKIATKLLSFPILHLSRKLSISIGVLLIVASKEIRMKVKRSYKFTWWLLLLGIVFTFTKGFDFEEAMFLAIVLILLRMSKTSFHRKSLPFDLFSTMIFSLIGFIGVVIYTKLSHVIFVDFFKAHYFKDILTNGFSKYRGYGIFTYVSLIGFLLIWEFTKERITSDSRYEELDEIKMKYFLENNMGSYQVHLVFLKDKHLFYASSNKVVLAYEKSHNIIVVLGDPIGDEDYFGEAIVEFQKFIDEYGFKSAFYEASEKYLSLYHQHGYYFFKLGETALVDLENFNISSPTSRDFRNVLSRFKRDGYEFELLEANSIDNELYASLEVISNEWLEGRNEMGFSLGVMDQVYLNRAQVGIIKSVESGNIIAFASLMPKYDYNKSTSIDLMRFKKDVPSNTMTFLILNLILFLKEKESEILNLGMAPLSNVGDEQNAHFKEKIAHLIYKHGKNVYSFDGLRKYKEKFNPIWKGRYLAYEDLTLLPSSLMEATFLIHSRNNNK